MPAKANVEVVVKGKDQASQAMGKMGKSADAMGAKFAKVGGILLAVGSAMLAAAGKMVSDYAKAGDEIAKMSRRTGIATEALSEMRHVAEISGTSLGSFEKGIKRMSRAIIDADAGMAEYKEAFDTLGLSLDDIMGKNPEEQFWIIADAIGTIEDPTLKSAIAQEIFGKAGTELIPVLDETKEKIADLRQEAHDLNIVFDEESAAAAEAQVDAFTNMSEAINGLKNAFAESIMPAVTAFVEMLTERLLPIISYLKDHPEIAQAFVKFGALFAAGGAIFLAIAGFIKLMAMFRIMLITIQALSGPTGWATLGIAAGVTIAAVKGFQKISADYDALTEGKAAEEEKNKPPAGYASWEVYKAVRSSWYGSGQTWEDYSAGRGLSGAAPMAEAPSFQYGGIVGGPVGRPQMVMAHGGESIGRGAGVVVNIGGSVVSERDLIEAVNEGILRRQSRNASTGFA